MRAEAILTCYRLAKYYARPPSEFLAMPLAEVEQHAWWTDYGLEVSEGKRPGQRDG